MRTKKTSVKNVIVYFAALGVLLAGAWGYLYFFPGDVLVRTFTHRLEKTLGVGAEAHKVEIDPVRGAIEISGLILSNPKGFPGREMAFVRRLRVEISPRSFLTAKNEIALLEIEADTVTIVRNQFKALNIQVLPASDESLRIGRLVMKIKEIVFLDYSTGEEPLVQTLPAGLETEHTGIEGLGRAAYLIMSDILNSPSVAKLDISKGQRGKLPLPMQSVERGFNSTAWTLEETAKGTASAVFGGIRATSGKIADLFDASRTSSSPLSNRLGEPYSGRETPARPAPQ